jgi:hypothetical protein
MALNELTPLKLNTRALDRLQGSSKTNQRGTLVKTNFNPSMSNGYDRHVGFSRCPVFL